jgi:uncharacterized protein
VRLVIDTNIVFSALLYGGKPLQILQLVIEGQVQAFASEWMLSELAGILSRPEHTARLTKLRITAAQVSDDYSGLIQFIIPKALEYKVSRDINDDPILACALSAKADFIVSGDKDLLVLKEFEGIQIVTAAQALERLLKTP